MVEFRKTRHQPRLGRRRSKGGEDGGSSARLPACRDANRRILRVRYSTAEALNSTIGQWVIEVARALGGWGIFLKETEDQLDIRRFIEYMRGCNFAVTVEESARARVEAETEYRARALVLHCPECGELHVDEKSWAYKLHRTHKCRSCGHKWRPFDYATVGVAELEEAGDDRTR